MNYCTTLWLTNSLFIVAGVLKEHALTTVMRAQTAGQTTIDIAMMHAHTARHDVTCHIIYTLFI